MNLYKTYQTITHPLSVALAAAQHHGILIDLDARADLKKKMETKIGATSARITELAKRDVNPNSPKQVAKLLYNDMKFPKMYSKKRTITADENALLTLLKRYPHEEILSAIVSYRKDTKLVSTFLDVAVDENNRMHTSYNASGTKNYRISSSKDLWGSGMNLQNIPVGKRPGVENIRHLFIAPPGFSLVKCDLRQAEAIAVSRILCRYKDYTLHSRYADDEFDIHKWAAAPIFNIREADCTKLQRAVGKLSNHAGNYCAGPNVIVSEALKYDVKGVDYQFAKTIIDNKKTMMPGLVKWWKAVEKRVRTTRTLTTCLERRRYFFGRTDDNTVIRDAVAFEPQSTIGDVCNIIFARLHEALTSVENSKSIPILQVHDECVIECPDDYVDTVVKLMREAAQIPLFLNRDLDPLIIPLDISVGKNWRDCVDVN